MAGSGGPFLWPPPKKVETREEGSRTPSWAPAGAPVNVPKPKKLAGPLPKRPPLLPTPPPPKDYDSIVIQASPSAAAQPSSADPKAHPLAAYASAPASAPAPVPAPAPAPAPVLAPACKLPEASKVPQSKVNVSTPAAKPAVTKPATGSKPIAGFKAVAAPKAPCSYKPISGQKSGPAPGAPSVLAHAPIPPPAFVPIVNSNPAPAPKPPAAAFASLPKPAAPKPPAPTGPAPVLPKPTGLPNLGGAGGAMKGVAQTSGQKPAPRRGRGVMNTSTSVRIPMCADCGRQIRGPFVSALGKTWCPDHFVCSTGSCRKALIDMGFVEEQGALHCEDCYERYLAPICGKCDKRVKGDCLNAVGKQFHPECFCCAYCGKIFGSGAFYLEDGLPYCEADWNDLFTTKCVGCGFPIEAGDRWVEALNNNYHSQCFKCSVCKSNLEGKSFYAKNGRPFCKSHAGR